MKERELIKDAMMEVPLMGPYKHQKPCNTTFFLCPLIPKNLLLFFNLAHIYICIILIYFSFHHFLIRSFFLHTCNNYFILRTNYQKSSKKAKIIKSWIILLLRKNRNQTSFKNKCQLKMKLKNKRKEKNILITKKYSYVH